jgi:2-dehydro-3-deoxygluconokinase
MSKVFCFGELLMRMSPQLGGEWIRNKQMPVFIGGAELNAATALAKWNIHVAYCTALPDNSLSQDIYQHLKERGIDASPILFSGERIGTYYLPQGADLKNAGVIYDRAHSSFSELKPGQVDWKELLKDVSWFHFSAINPALNKNVAAVCKEALQAATDMAITISVDLNYRAKLWQYGLSPVEVMPELVQYCDVIMGNIWAEEKMLGIAIPSQMEQRKEFYLEQSLLTSKQIFTSFSKCKQVANTFRFDEGAGVRYYATFYDGNSLFVSTEHKTDNIVDKVGSGDTFMAGLIYGNFHGHAAQDIIDFAAAAAFNKLFIKGDATTASAEEIKKAYLNYA